MPFLRSRAGLLVRFRAGEPDALAEVYWAYFDQVERLVRHGCYHVRAGRGAPRTHEVADIVQEVYIRAFSERVRLAYDGLRDFGPYLTSIARNVIIDWARKRDHHLSFDELDFDLEDEGAESSGAAPWTDERRLTVVDQYLGSVSSELRALHHHRYVAKLSQEAAAAALRLSRQQLRTQEKRLRAGLLQALIRAGLWPP
jgi:RNA polymerase sigma-70 factor (ECF subfamily)